MWCTGEIQEIINHIQFTEHMSVNKSHSKKAIITMYVSALCLPAVSMIAGCSGTHSRDCASSLLHGLVAGEETASDAGGECRSGKDCTCQEQV